MKDLTEEALDILLREQFNAVVPDEGFCKNLMRRLPARRRRKGWGLAAGFAVGVGASGISLGSSVLLSSGWQDLLSGIVSPGSIVLLSAMSGMAALALAWAVAETDDRPLLSLPRVLS